MKFFTKRNIYKRIIKLLFCEKEINRKKIVCVSIGSFSRVLVELVEMLGNCGVMRDCWSFFWDCFSGPKFWKIWWESRLIKADFKGFWDRSLNRIVAAPKGHFGLTLFDNVKFVIKQNPSKWIKKNPVMADLWLFCKLYESLHFWKIDEIPKNEPNFRANCLFWKKLVIAWIWVDPGCSIA
jgi:hypothetical protein